MDKPFNREIKIPANDLIFLLRRRKEINYGGFKGKLAYISLMEVLEKYGLSKEEIKECL